MAITFKEIQEYIDAESDNLYELLEGLDKAIVKARNKRKIPIYSTKYRVKASESAFLKVKRRSFTSLSEITDLAAMRILCLFENDILEAHIFLINMFISKKYKLTECEIYNWKDEELINKISQNIKNIFPEINLESKERKSGYKSLHYLIKDEASEHLVEIQLRTLFQDAWGELEHSLSYKKGSIHPHIKQSFILLAKELESKDKLISHLKIISDLEGSGERYSNEKIGPRNMLGYEDEIMPSVFKGSSEVKQAHDNYWNFMRGVTFKSTNNKSWIKEARTLLNAIAQEISALQAQQKEFYYWREMEEAFLLFCEYNYNEAMDKYEALFKKDPEHYALQFRMGEIHFIKGATEKALERFDESERLLEIQSSSDHKNKYYIKTRLALVYWYLGDEYIDIALKEIKDAQNIMMKNNQSSFDENDRKVLANNLCWYSLDKYIINRNDAEVADSLFEDAKMFYLDLKRYLDEYATSNMFDTAAWFCLHAFRKTKEMEYLTLAKSYCEKMREKANYTSFNFRSMNMHMNHIKEIINEK